MKNLISIIIPFFYGDDKKYARWGGLLMIFLSQFMTALGYFFIQWNRRFYDALENKDGSLFFKEVMVFAALSITLAIVSSVNKYFGQQYAIRWRIWMTRNALSTWLVNDQRASIEGSDQRIQEDLMRFTIIFERIFINCVNSVMLIILFIPLLFAQTYSFQFLNISLAWVIIAAVILYTIIGMFIAAKIANPLITYEYNNQKIEAEFRYNLVHARDGAIISLDFFKDLMHKISLSYNKVYNRQKYFNLWQEIYNQFSFLIPFLLLGSNYFAGLLTLGMLMQIRSTFSRIRNSMAYLMDKYTELTEMLAISRRLVEFYNSQRLLTTALPQHSLVIVRDRPAYSLDH